MPITEERILRLRDFGLSEYASRAYLALLDLGLTEAREVSTLSKVPTSKIYHVLEHLHEKGLVIILPEFPKKYAPVPFGEYLEKLQREHEEAMGAIDRDRPGLVDMFSVTGTVEMGDRGNFTVVRGRRNTLAKIGEIVAATSRDLMIVGSRGLALRADVLHDDLKRARDRGARIRFSLPVVAEALPAVAALEALGEVRARDLDDVVQGGSVAIVLSDASRAFLVHFLPDDGHLYQGKDTGFFTDHEAMIAALTAMIEPLWKREVAFSVKRKELEAKP